MNVCEPPWPLSWRIASGSISVCHHFVTGNGDDFAGP
jgi:hypothetical protein